MKNVLIEKQHINTTKKMDSRIMNKHVKNILLLQNIALVSNFLSLLNFNNITKTQN